MTQKLYVKTKDGSQIEVNILRSWSDISGRHIFHHAQGHYGYKDGTPLISETEFDSIGDPGQRTQAKNWWKRTGRAMSEKYYAQAAALARESIGDFRIVEDETMTSLDAVLYTRRPTLKGAISKPRSWMEWFAKRPDWWGQARKIDFLDYVYEMVQEETAPDTMQAPGTDQGPDPDAKWPRPKEAMPIPDAHVTMQMEA
jgi:hypothetical protein